MNIEKETLLRLSECEHLMRTNVEIENYEIDESEPTEDAENPGFTKGWHYFLDIVSNSVISFPGSEPLKELDSFVIEVRISDDIVAKFENPELIEEFLSKCEKKSRYFSNVANLVVESKVSKKLGL